MAIDDVARFFAGIAREPGRAAADRNVGRRLDGLPGFVVVQNGEVMHTMAFEIDDGKITAIYVVRNPDKLRPRECGRRCSESKTPLPPARTCAWWGGEKKS